MSQPDEDGVAVPLDPIRLGLAIIGFLAETFGDRVFTHIEDLYNIEAVAAEEVTS